MSLNPVTTWSPTTASTASRGSMLYSWSSMADSAAGRSGTSTSARNPSLPRFTPSTGARCRSASRSARSIVPSPPRLTTRSDRWPSSAAGTAIAAQFSRRISVSMPSTWTPLRWAQPRTASTASAESRAGCNTMPTTCIAAGPPYLSPALRARLAGGSPATSPTQGVIPFAEDTPMPLQNRVTPSGEIVADPSRGLLMGNRGCLHGQGRTLGVSRWRSKLWICCLLDFKGVQRDPMPPGRWTALFFLDEATALSAGHRPCAYCRRPDYLAFTQAWRAARHLPRSPLAADMDAALHAERTDRYRRKLSYRAQAAELPDGVMVRIGGEPGLLIGGQACPWSFRGYGAPPASPSPFTAGPGEVEVLTPPSIVAAITAGYRPLVHHSALAGDRSPGVRIQD